MDRVLTGMNQLIGWSTGLDVFRTPRWDFGGLESRVRTVVDRDGAWAVAGMVMDGRYARRRDPYHQEEQRHAVQSYGGMTQEEYFAMWRRVEEKTPGCVRLTPGEGEDMEPAELGRALDQEACRTRQGEGRKGGMRSADFGRPCADARGTGQEGGSFWDNFL